MEKYKNIRGTSGVYAYEIADESITIQFNTGALYLYNNSKPGKRHVDMMKRLAVNGSGLNSLISSEVRSNCFKLS
ncbi:MAG: hypothetical protein K0S53_786 [Bacteroidetes bacterium]|jgi:hypothetical protein|nr:hypothetical protein [Bacteroidota bacterium]